LIGVVVAATAMLVGLYQARAGVSSESSIKWIGFTGMTTFAFGYAIYYSRRFWRSPKFWWFLAAFLVLHLALGFVIVPKLTDARLIHFAIATPVEYFVLTACLNRLLSRQESP